jgi:hypothetical protein
MPDHHNGIQVSAGQPSPRNSVRMSSSLEPEHLRCYHTTACLEGRSPYPGSRHGASLPIQCEQDTDRDGRTQSCWEEENMMDEIRVGDHLSVDLLGPRQQNALQ